MSLKNVETLELFFLLNPEALGKLSALPKAAVFVREVYMPFIFRNSCSDNSVMATKLDVDFGYTPEQICL